MACLSCEEKKKERLLKYTLQKNKKRIQKEIEEEQNERKRQKQAKAIKKL